jgi:hypothetical protein
MSYDQLVLANRHERRLKHSFNQAGGKLDTSIIWSLRKPLQWAWRKLVVFAGARTVEPIFRQAHDYHISLRRWQRRWVELADGVEYQLHTCSSFDEDNNAEQSIWIRNTGEVIVDEMHFCVEAKLGSFSYQVPLSAYRVRPGCTARLALIGLPLKDLIVHEERIFPTYESIQVYPMRIARDHHVELYSTDGIVWSPSHGDYLDGGWKRWDGRLYNVKAIADARYENLVRLAHSLCWRHGFFGMDIATLIAQALRARRYRRLPGLLMFALISSGPVLNAILWTRLLLGIERIAFECDPATTAATEFVLNKGQSARPVRLTNSNPASSNR